MASIGSITDVDWEAARYGETLSDSGAQNIFDIMDNQKSLKLSVGWNYLYIPKLQLCNRWSLGIDK